ncbi:MAG: hypothetical protein GY780_05745 [bacterium]|nr:hypothetical protein [bacterium]
MKRIAIALLFVLIAVSAQAATIYDIQNGLYDEGAIVDLYGVTVSAVRYNGVWVSEAPHGAYNGIWVYGPTELAVGTVVNLTAGEYTEYYDLSEIMNPEVLVLNVGEAPAPTVLNAADLFGGVPLLAYDPEAYESCLVTIADGMTVTEILTYGQWLAVAEDGTPVLFDDYLFDSSTVLVGDCYNSATGILDYSFGEFKLQALEDGVALVDCTVATEEVSFEGIKALYR